MCASLLFSLLGGLSSDSILCFIVFFPGEFSLFICWQVLGVAEFTNTKAIGNDGYLASKGLIPLPESDRAKFEKAGKSLTKFDENVLKK